MDEERQQNKLQYTDPAFIMTALMAVFADLITMFFVFLGPLIFFGVLAHYLVGFLYAFLIFPKIKHFIPRLILLLAIILPLPTLSIGLLLAVIMQNKIIAFILEQVGIAIAAVVLAPTVVGEGAVVAAESAAATEVAAGTVEAGAEIATQAGRAGLQTLEEAGAQAGRAGAKAAAETAEKTVGEKIEEEVTKRGKKALKRIAKRGLEKAVGEGEEEVTEEYPNQYFGPDYYEEAVSEQEEGFPQEETEEEATLPPQEEPQGVSEEQPTAAAAETEVQEEQAPISFETETGETGRVEVGPQEETINQPQASGLEPTQTGVGRAPLPQGGPREVQPTAAAAPIAPLGEVEETLFTAPEILPETPQQLEAPSGQGEVRVTKEISAQKTEPVPLKVTQPSTAPTPEPEVIEEIIRSLEQTPPTPQTQPKPAETAPAKPEEKPTKTSPQPPTIEETLKKREDERQERLKRQRAVEEEALQGILRERTQLEKPTPTPLPQGPNTQPQKENPIDQLIRELGLSDVPFSDTVELNGSQVNLQDDADTPDVSKRAA